VILFLAQNHSPMTHLPIACAISADVEHLTALGTAMVANTNAQGELHPALVSADASQFIDLARKHGACGWKVNAAGGDGGSLTILCAPEADCRHSILSVLRQMNPIHQVIPIRLCKDGLTCWEAIT
jgi:D-glycero-alpha-D-manno-heptose-7-phosphate kinase